MNGRGRVFQKTGSDNMLITDQSVSLRLHSHNEQVMDFFCLSKSDNEFERGGYPNRHQRHLRGICGQVDILTHQVSPLIFQLLTGIKNWGQFKHTHFTQQPC